MSSGTSDEKVQGVGWLSVLRLFRGCRGQIFLNLKIVHYMIDKVGGDRRARTVQRVYRI